jgi:hypothetical protein
MGAVETKLQSNSRYWSFKNENLQVVNGLKDDKGIEKRFFGEFR